MKETRELAVFLASLINTGVNVFEDGKVNADDLPKVLDTALKASPAFKDLGGANNELATAPIGEYIALQEATGSNLTALPEKQAYLVNQLLNGIFAGWGLVATQAYNKGVEAGWHAGQQGKPMSTALAK
jgi:hypothetical protein